jgi:hypothetical protein
MPARVKRAHSGNAADHGRHRTGREQRHRPPGSGMLVLERRRNRGVDHLLGEGRVERDESGAQLGPYLTREVVVSETVHGLPFVRCG